MAELKEEGAMYYVGLDLGQKRDHAAIAVVKKSRAPRWCMCGIWRGWRSGRRIRAW